MYCMSLSLKRLFCCNCLQKQKKKRQEPRRGRCSDADSVVLWLLWDKHPRPLTWCFRSTQCRCHCSLNVVSTREGPFRWAKLRIPWKRHSCFSMTPSFQHQPEDSAQPHGHKHEHRQQKCKTFSMHEAHDRHHKLVSGNWPQFNQKHFYKRLYLFLCVVNRFPSLWQIVLLRLIVFCVVKQRDADWHINFPDITSSHHAKVVLANQLGKNKLHFSPWDWFKAFLFKAFLALPLRKENA